MTRQDVARQLHKACVEVGFLYVTNHGVDPRLTTRALEQARAFFALPQVLQRIVIKSD